MEIQLQSNALTLKTHSCIGYDGTKGLFARRRPNSGFVGGRDFFFL